MEGEVHETHIEPVRNSDHWLGSLDAGCVLFPVLR